MGLDNILEHLQVLPLVLHEDHQPVNTLHPLEPFLLLKDRVKFHRLTHASRLNRVIHSSLLVGQCLLLKLLREALLPNTWDSHVAQLGLWPLALMVHLSWDLEDHMLVYHLLWLSKLQVQVKQW